MCPACWVLGPQVCTTTSVCACLIGLSRSIMTEKTTFFFVQSDLLSPPAELLGSTTLTQKTGRHSESQLRNWVPVLPNHVDFAFRVKHGQAAATAVTLKMWVIHTVLERNRLCPILHCKECQPLICPARPRSERAICHIVEEMRKNANNIYWEPAMYTHGLKPLTWIIICAHSYIHASDSPGW
jgi:hypothetical protein